jgi:hypothetical protein
MHTPGPWTIDWYICRDNKSGEELWRVPRSIGPAHVDHDHWAGAYINVDEADAHVMAAARDLLTALQFAVSRVELANAEGNPILSAWLTDARAAIALATSKD